jgi:hypothetical protein
MSTLRRVLTRAGKTPRKTQKNDILERKNEGKKKRRVTRLGTSVTSPPASGKPPYVQFNNSPHDPGKEKKRPKHDAPVHYNAPRIIPLWANEYKQGETQIKTKTPVQQ